MKMYIVDAETGERINHENSPSVMNTLMLAAGLDWGMGFEDIGIQGDGTPVIFDRCGGFGYLDSNKYRVVIDIVAE